MALLQLCQRNSNQPEEKTTYHAMWLSVFELVLTMLNRYKASINPHLLEGDPFRSNSLCYLRLLVVGVVAVRANIEQVLVHFMNRFL